MISTTSKENSVIYVFKNIVYLQNSKQINLNTKEKKVRICYL